VRIGESRKLYLAKPAGTQATTITYEPGSDQRQTITVDGVYTAYGFDSAGRVATRTDTVDGKPFQTTYGYYNTDALREITYPNGRTVRYNVDDELRITRVYDPVSDANYASLFTCHPSGAVASYRAGNNLDTAVTLHAQRYWPAQIPLAGCS
jgi:uncharacterized protein RhaS with RHS repeats